MACLNRGMTWLALHCRETSQLPPGEWAGGGPGGVAVIGGGAQREVDIRSPHSGTLWAGGPADLRPWLWAARCSPHWLEERQTLASKGKGHICSAVETGLPSPPGQGRPLTLCGSLVSPGPSDGPLTATLEPPRNGAPSSPPLTILSSQVSDRDLLFLFLSHQTHPILSSSLRVTGTDLDFYFQRAAIDLNLFLQADIDGIPQDSGARTLM